MRGYPHVNNIKEKCIILRLKGYSLNELVKITEIPKTTIHDWVSHQVILPQKAQSRLERRIKNGCIKGNISSKRASIKIIPQIIGWTSELISVVAHFLFDGFSTSRKEGYVYCSRNIAQIERVNNLMKRVFKLDPHASNGSIGIIRTGFYSVHMVKLIEKKKDELIQFIPKANLEQKRSFLRAFFDDEGTVSFSNNLRRVRGFQHSSEILKLIKKLLKDFEIDSHIDKINTEVAISGKENLIKFRDEINFSPGIYINPNRKNSIWKRKIDKRTILEKAINSYQH